MIVIAVLGGKGGIAKSYATQSFATEFQIQNKFKTKGLIVDLDPSINSTNRACAVDNRPITLADVFANPNIDPNKAVYPATDKFPGIRVMAGSTQFDYVDTLIAQRKNTDTILQRALQQIKPTPSFVFIDCPPSRGTLVSNALTACDAYIVPFIPDENSIDGVLAIERLVDELLYEQSIETRPIRLGAFCSMVDKGNSEATKNVMNVAKEYLKEHCLPFEIPHSVHVREAITNRSTLQYERKHKVSLEYQKITKHIMKKMQAEGYRV